MYISIYLGTIGVYKLSPVEILQDSTHTENWNAKIPGFTPSEQRFKALKKYTACDNGFLLSAQQGGLEHSTLGDIYPNFPFMQANFTGSGFICAHMFLKDPNFWFFFATNFHPGISAQEQAQHLGSDLLPGKNSLTS